MSEMHPLRKHNLVRTREEYDLDDVIYYARDILLKEDGVQQTPALTDSKNASWSTSAGEVRLYGAHMDVIDATYTLFVDGPDSSFESIVYTFSAGNNLPDYVSATEVIRGDSLDQTPTESIEQIMEYLRTHPSVSEPMMNELGRERLRHIEDGLVKVISDKNDQDPYE